MNAREFAKKNEVRTESVRERCKEGMIPLAEKKSGRWDIPDNAEMPPCTGHEAALIIENLIENASGRNVLILPARMAQRGEAALHYLSSWGFISNPDEKGIITVSSRGLELLESRKNISGTAYGDAESGSKFKRSAFGAKLKTHVKLPGLSLQAEIGYNHENAEQICEIETIEKHNATNDNIG